MILVNSYNTILNTHNWFYNNVTNNFIYSDGDVTITNIFIHIPFNENKEYNKDLLKNFNNFLCALAKKISIYYNIRIKYNNIDLDTNSSYKQVVNLKQPIITADSINILYELTIRHKIL